MAPLACRGHKDADNTVIAYNIVIVVGMAHVNEARLVDEAARLLVEHGPAGLSLRKVAAAAGVSTMPVYTLFGDKEGLLAAMHREGSAASVQPWPPCRRPRSPSPTWSNSAWRTGTRPCPARTSTG